MAIGWSVGDIIACSQLAYKLIQALKDSGGAQTVYQALINDLSSIHRSLLEVTQMHHASQLSTATVNAILYEAHSLTKIMDDYLATIEAYHSALSGLSAKSSANRYRDMVKKLRWSFAETGAVQALRNRLASHSQSIITLIAVATFKVASDPEDALYNRYHERDKATVEDIDTLIVHKHIAKGAGGPEDGTADLVEPSYQRIKQPEKFFRVGQVFQMIDSLSEPDSREGTYISYVKSCYIGGHRVRRFVVAQEGTKASICLKIATFAGQGCAHQKRQSDFGIVHTSRQVPNKLPGEEAITKQPIRVKVAHPAGALHHASRVDYGTVYSVRVKSVGLVHVDSMLQLIEYFEHWETDQSNTQPKSEMAEMPVPSEVEPRIERARQTTDPENSNSDTTRLKKPPSDESQKSTKILSDSQLYKTLITEPLLERCQSSRRVRRSSSLPLPKKPRSLVVAI